MCILFGSVSFAQDMKAARAGNMTPVKASYGLFIFLGFGAGAWLFAFLGGLSS
jgi:hypothetical protein